jgi:hypothetical protein
LSSNRSLLPESGTIVILVAAVAWVLVAALLAGGSLAGKHSVIPPSGVSPACLPATLNHDATLPGTSVDVSPAPGTDTANAATQISFLGTPAAELRDISVEGSSSGRHAGRRIAYYQGDGASFVPDRPFAAGERVSVRALIGASRSEHESSFSFRVATPYSTAGIAGFPNPPAPSSAYQSFVSAPGLQPPPLAVTSADRDPGAGDLFMTVGPGPGQAGPLVYSPTGRLVWFDDLPKGLNAENLSVQRYEGQDDLTWWQGHVLVLGFGQGEDVVMDHSYRTVATVLAGNGYQADLHDFQIAPHEVAYVSAYNLMRCDLGSVGGRPNGVVVDTAVQEIDMKTGLVRWEWHSLDHVGVAESHAPVPTTAVPWDYFHLNSIDPEPGGDLLVSARSTWAAYQLHGGSGKILWRLAGTNSSFRADPDAQTAWQHDARMLPDGRVTMFDNGSNPRVHDQSRGVRVAIDPARHTVRLVRSYPHPAGPLLADSQGNMQTLPGEQVVLGWGAVPSVSELGKDGGLLFDAHLPPGSSSYRAFRFPWTGRPQWPPAVSARLLAAEDSTAVFASWNGASDVASWRVLAGTGPASLRSVARMPVSGFESSIIIPGAFADVAVQAVGSAGQVLATSPVTQVQRPPMPPQSG